jgi:hypothetical protein
MIILTILMVKFMLFYYHLIIYKKNYYKGYNILMVFNELINK